MAERARDSEASRSGAWRERVDGWLDSDLVGIPATLYTFGVLAVSLAVFRFGGPIAGIVVAIGLWVPMVVFAIRGWGREPGALRVARGPANRHRVLVIANRGLENGRLCEAICRRGERVPAEALVLAPVTAPSALGEFADDVDDELAPAGLRVERAVSLIEERGVRARGRADLADPVQVLLDGLREFPPNEVVLAPGSERGWGDAGALVERVEAEAGLPVTVLDPAIAAEQ